MRVYVATLAALVLTGCNDTKAFNENQRAKMAKTAYATSVAFDQACKQLPQDKCNEKLLNTIAKLNENGMDLIKEATRVVPDISVMLTYETKDGYRCTWNVPLNPEEVGMPLNKEIVMDMGYSCSDARYGRYIYRQPGPLAKASFS
jgi:hypothetical protein